MASYVYGNAVRKQNVEQVPERKQKEVSQRVRMNRTKAMHMNRGYVAFLAAAAILALFLCVQYLQLQSEITNRSKHITALQQELADVKEENTTRYNAMMNSMNLEDIRNIAIQDFGMVYAGEDQIIRYQSPSGSAVTQYASIPESGVVASSDIVK